MAINERLVHTASAAAAAGAGNQEEGLILHLDANDVDSYDGDGDVWYDISEHDVTVPLSDNADDLELHLNASDSTSYGGSGTTWTDISGNSRNATLTSAVSATYDKDNGGYFEFTAASVGVTVPHDTAFNSSTDITLECWVKRDDTTEDTIINKGDDGTNSWFLMYNPSNGYYYYNYATGGGVKSGTSGLSTGQWEHVVVTTDASGSKKIYVNGENKTITVGGSGTTSISDTGVLNIGGRNLYLATGNAGLNGDIGQVRFYSKVLSASEIGQNYRHGRDYIYTDLIDDTDLGVHLDAGNTDSYDPSSDGSTWSDLTTSNADVTLTSMNADQHDKEIGGWFSFDGSADYGTITNDAVRVTTGGALTVEMWIRPSTISVSNKYFLGQSQNTNASYSYSVNQTNQTLRLLTYSHSGGFAYAVQLTTGNVLTQANKWYHFAFTLSDTVADNVIYINGENVKQATSNGIGTERGNTNQLQIGAINGGNNWQGDIGQVRIYQETLTADQIRQNFNFTKNDYPNGNDLTLYNSPTFEPTSPNYLRFDSANDEARLSSVNIPIDGGFTFSVYIRRHTSVSGYHQLLRLTGTGYPSYLFAIAGNTDIQYFVANSGTGNSLSTYSDGRTWTNNQWIHVLYTKENGNGSSNRGELYINGTSTNTATNLSDNTDITNIYINRDASFPTSRNAQCDVGYMKIYDKSFTDDEALAEFNATKDDYGL